MLGFRLNNDGRLFFELPLGGPFQAWMHLKEWAGNEPESLRLKQIHGKTVRLLEDLAAQKDEMEGDGILLLENDDVAVASLRYADCVPVVVCCSGSKRWMLGLHSGFQGTRQNIVASGIEIAKIHAGPFETKDLSAWIGPSIGSCCYSRQIQGDPVTLKALEEFTSDAVPHISADKAFFDVRAQIRHQLIVEGLSPESIFIWPECTACHPETYHSYRRGEHKKRMTLFLSRSRSL